MSNVLFISPIPLKQHHGLLRCLSKVSSKMSTEVVWTTENVTKAAATFLATHVGATTRMLHSCLFQQVLRIAVPLTILLVSI